MCTTGSSCFFWGLTFLIIGNGFLKPNVSSIVGELYEKDVLVKSYWTLLIETFQN
ncbi:hypothetical protein [Piscirickettsia salmonis]|uniref:POT-type proton-dependent oligopeptide transporter n=1 Tax=Piscirickettsia salmonis TaxID=1238 RepID=UPI0018C88C14